MVSPFDQDLDGCGRLGDDARALAFGEAGGRRGGVLPGVAAPVAGLAAPAIFITCLPLALQNLFLRRM